MPRKVSEQLDLSNKKTSPPVVYTEISMRRSLHICMRLPEISENYATSGDGVEGENDACEFHHIVGVRCDGTIVHAFDSDWSELDTLAHCTICTCPQKNGGDR